MKQDPQAISVDMRERDASNAITVNSAVLTSRDTSWQNLILEHHRQPAHEMPEVAFKQHLLVIPLNEIIAEYRMGDRHVSKTSQKGDLVLIPAEANYWNVDRNEAEFIVLSIEPQHLLYCNHELIQGEELELIPTFSKPDPFIYGTALALQQQLITDHHGSDLYVESLLNSLCIHVLHKYASKKPLIRNCRDGLPAYKLKQALNYINDNLEHTIKLTDIAEMLNMSQYYFCRLFRESTGVSPYRYTIQQRVNKAKRLIKNSNLPLSDIAFECGFSSQSQMNQHFRKLVGVTPKKYSNLL